MKHHYRDIRERIPEDPQWFDEHGAPRYCAFSPQETANPYASQAVLYEIECQGCGQGFEVCSSQDAYDLVPEDEDDVVFSLEQAVRLGRLHYGDPPNVGCCGAGSVMNSIPKRVIEFWKQERPGERRMLEWVRHPELEGELPPLWTPPDEEDLEAARESLGPVRRVQHEDNAAKAPSPATHEA